MILLHHCIILHFEKLSEVFQSGTASQVAGRDFWWASKREGFRVWLTGMENTIKYALHGYTTMTINIISKVFSYWTSQVWSKLSAHAVETLIPQCSDGSYFCNAEKQGWQHCKNATKKQPQLFYRDLFRMTTTRQRMWTLWTLESAKC